ncbi:MAG TPA: hypothetical protein PKC06_09015 [Saprospiraceae bacterium]|nr:hypothetical protein [Saprospiraceae bacterium]
MNFLKLFLSVNFLIFFLSLQGQVLVQDLNPGLGNAVQDYGTKSIQIGDKIFFIASADGVQEGLYVFSNNKIEFLKEMCSSCPTSSQLFLHNGKLYFTNKENSKFKIYETDGTKDNVNLVIEINQSFYGTNVIPSGNKLYFNEENVGIHVLENGIDKIIPGTKNLNLNTDNSPDKNRALVDGDKLLVISKPKSDSLALYEITDKVVTLGKLKVEFGSDYQYGLKKVKNGYICVYDGDLINYNASNKTLAPLNLSSITGRILSVLDFKPNQPMLYVYNDGIFVINDTENVSVSKISDIWDSVLQDSEFAKAYYNNKMLLLTSDFNTSFKDYALLTDGTKASTIATKVPSYTSSLVQKDQHVFFASGITNGYEPSIYYFDMTKTAPVVIKAFTESSNNFTSIIPIGIIGTKLYYFSNLDTKYGRELYYIETGIKTQTNDYDLSSNDYYTLNSNGTNFTIQTNSNETEQINITLIDINGRIINKFDSRTDEAFSIPLKNQVVFVSVESSQKTNKCFFKTISF